MATKKTATKRPRTAAALAAERAYEARHREKRKLQQFEKHQRHLAARRAKRQAANRARGHAERPKGLKARVELIVPASRKWRIFTHPDGICRVHFTSKKGFELDELQQIQREFKALKSQVALSQFPPNAATGKGTAPPPAPAHSAAARRS